MGTGIIVCGLNGVGKSTLGKALAERLRVHFIDCEGLFFPGTDSRDPYALPRTREEAERLLLREMEAHGAFVLAAVKGDYGAAVVSSFRYAVLMTAPKAVRVRRVEQRSFRKFGSRMREGGDLYEQEARFFELVRTREENMVEDWARYLTCPVIRIDGTKPVEENVNLIVEQMDLRRRE